MIELEEVSKNFGDVSVVRSLTLTARRGEITVLIGPSGCGKTTTLEMMNGLTPPSQGTIKVGGDDLTEADLIELRRRIGYVIQSGGLFPHYTIFDNVALVPRLLGWGETRIRDRAREMLELVKVPLGKLESYPRELSGGQRQRIGVARALAADPEYLLMDEPFGAIDPLVRGHIQEEFLAIQAALKKTVVMVTHDMDEALKMGDRVAILDKGDLIQFDTPEAILQRPANGFVEDFLGGDPRLRYLALHDTSVVLDPSDRAEHGVRVREEASLAEVLSLLLSSDSDHVTVHDAAGEVLGAISLAKLRAFLSGNLGRASA